MNIDPSYYPLTVRVFPISGAVLYPRMLLPLHIFEERYKLLVNEALKGDRRLAVSLLRKDPGDIVVPSTVCGLGEIVELQELDQGEKNILVRGLSRIEIGEIAEEVPYVRARARVLQEVGGTAMYSARRRQALKQLAQQFLFLVNAKETMSLTNFFSFVTNGGFLTDFVAYYLLEDLRTKQELLEILDVDERMRRAHQVLEAALQLLDP
ncbi:MAG: hypothetical protein A2Y95_10090 [Deltaproteobacteria bacterium RBG_13_65_10]|jgi:ATP-dependent Lon protease|nr:MAG: hypothetical protein A2Y95_10090 [Deltaproteobacteria bacterium RBG_13_65_10]